jgi:hypothetical protein
MGFFATLMEIVITHMRGTWEHSSPVTQRVCDPNQLGATTSGNNIFGFLSTRYPAKLASEEPSSEMEEDAEYRRPSSGVYRRYLKIRLMACRCEVLDDA